MPENETALKLHTLKCWPPFFEDVLAGHKTFELRRHDRDYMVGDTLHLREWTGTGYSGRECSVRVTYLLENAEQFGLIEGFVVLGIAKKPHGRPTSADELDDYSEWFA